MADVGTSPPATGSRHAAPLRSAVRSTLARGSFVSYATPTILGELRRHFRDKGWGVHVTRAVQENHLAISAATERLYGTLGRAPNAREIAAETGLSVADTIEALSAATSYTPAALDAPLASDDPDVGRCLGDSLGTVDPGFEHAELRASVGPAFQALPRREQRILYLRFVKDLTQSEIAAEIGISQMHVSRLLRQALDQLHTAADPAPAEAA